MSASSPVVLILGAGANIGQAVGKAFASRGYKVAFASRRANEQDKSADRVHIAADFSHPESVGEVFSKVKASLGLPCVVVYNAAAATMNEATNPLSVPLETLVKDQTINTHSAFAAAQQAIQTFEQLPASASRTFIYTGNITNEVALGPLLTLGVGKSATAHIIRSAAAAYSCRGYKFYYADERKPDGSPAFRDVDGDAHAEMYVSLAEGDEQGPWQQTFVKGVGYKKFPLAAE